MNKKSPSSTSVNTPVKSVVNTPVKSVVNATVNATVNSAVLTSPGEKQSDPSTNQRSTSSPDQPLNQPLNQSLNDGQTTLPFWPLFWTQFFGALNDNYFKNALVILLTFRNAELFGLDSKSLVAFSGAVFILPFLLFSPIAGQISDRMVKAKLAVGVKVFEILIMVLAGVAFYTHHFEILFISLFLMGVHSTLFGPLKYSMIPELLPEEKLVRGNALVEAGTFLAILGGTLGSGLALSLTSEETGIRLVIGGLLLFAVIGLVTSLKIPQLPPANPDLKLNWNYFSQLRDMTRLVRETKAVESSVLGISWFWFFGAGVLSMLPVITQSTLGANAEVVTLFLGVFTLGIGLGSYFSEKLSFNQVEIGLVPLGSFGMSLFLVDLAYALNRFSAEYAGSAGSTASVAGTAAAAYGVKTFLATPGSIRICIDFLGIALSGGFFTVPLYTLMQGRSRKEVRSQIVGANNVLNALFMVTSAVLLMLLYAVNLSIPGILLVFAGLNLVVAIYIYSGHAEYLWRFACFVMAHVLYRVRPRGALNIPKEGPALIICNHVSFVDWLIVQACVERPIRFVMYYKFFYTPGIHYFFKHSKCIPLAGKSEDLKLFEEAFKRISAELRDGQLVFIMPEGGITWDGQLQEFKKGMDYILSKDPVPVIPMGLGGLWGSFFSRKDKSLLRKRPRKFWKPISLEIGRPITPPKVEDVEAFRVLARDEVLKLTEIAHQRIGIQMHLGSASGVQKETGKKA